MRQSAPVRWATASDVALFAQCSCGRPQRFKSALTRQQAD